MSETPFIETEALLLAIQTKDADDHEQLREYLREKFFIPGELMELKDACRVLLDAIEDLLWEM